MQLFLDLLLFPFTCFGQYNFLLGVSFLIPPLFSLYSIIRPHFDLHNRQPVD